MELHHHATRTTLALFVLLVAGCGETDDGGPLAPDADCVEIHGSGETHGHVRSLAGHGSFTFDGNARAAQVGVYLNNLRDVEGEGDGGDGRKRVDIVYQFWWDNGDMVLTENHVYLRPLLEEGRYAFDANLFVKSGLGMFAGMEGQHAFDFSAELHFGPPEPGRSLGSVTERFTAGGTVCRG